ncbi:MAG: hypothetical protein PHO37_04670 [Kiritimatiellae bacterium]|nr:hypothetical protein [Kiritimatiellia bacterium]
MKKFWMIYGLVAIAGSVGIYFTAPLARPLMERFVKQEEEKTVVTNAFQAVGEPFGNDVAKPERQPSVKPGVPPVTVVEANDIGDPPALMGIFRASGREKPSWGVVQTKTNLYAEDGKRLGEVPAGVVVYYKEARVSSKGTMAWCTLLLKGKEEGAFLIKRSDLVLFTGDYEKLTARQRATVEDYYKTKGELDDRKKELMHQLAIRNPYYTQYKTAYEVYMAHIDKAKTLTAKRDAAEGLIRSSLDDQLRRMKAEGTALQKTYDEVHLKYKGWKEANAASLPDPAKDQKINEYRSEMQRLAKLIPGLAY